MELQFSANQQYQLDAIGSVVDLFEGQPQAAGAGSVRLEGMLPGLDLTEKGLANRLDITEAQLLENCRKVQAANSLAPSEALVRAALDTGEEFEFSNFTVEMETGTGKTYVYLRTIYQLHEEYGFKKFVVVVPSVAIREGVLKNLKITHAHLQGLYNHEPCSFSVYDSGKVNALRSFALSNAIEILVINIDSFSKDSGNGNGADGGNGNGGKKPRKSKGNVINQLRETGLRPIEFIQATNPIVIVDEPQNFETDIRKQALARLKPLCTLRYSATPRNAYNLVYRLDPIRALKEGLVKQIGVDSVTEGADANQSFVELQGFRTGRRSVSARVKIWVNTASGPAKKTVPIKNGDDLYRLSSGREIYKNGFIVNEIDSGEELIRFANDVTVRSGQPHGALTETILRLQVEATVRRHFEKEARLRPLGIKVLSVFFIDRVANYRTYAEDGSAVKGKFALWFEEIFEQYRAKPEFEGLYPFGAAQAHNGYFSRDKQGHFKDSTEKGSQDDNDTYALIMSKKEELLDPAVPLRFIFSHSALREGWDNPNVFQICTLAETASELKKRQEIGRGLRLAVNDKGERILDRGINRLTIVANESFEDFALALQTEMEEQGIAFKKDLVQNERKTVIVRLKKGYEADRSFLDLWERIRERTRYRVRYATSKLVDDAVAAIRKLPPIERPKVVIARASLQITDQGVASVEIGRRTHVAEAHYVMPDFVAQVQGKTSLSKSTVAAILLRCGRLQDAIGNPQAFIDQVAGAVNDAKRALLVEGVEYAKVDGLVYEMRRFKDADSAELFEANVVAVQRQEKTLFSHIVIDSVSGPERAFAQACENNEDVHFYIKLPRWFEIETPVGPYNPDWALVYRNDRTLYFVAETKDTGGKGPVSLSLLRPLEQLKVECGKRHFKQFEQVSFRVVKSLADLIA
ncbi:MAG TPA: DEAD/DEAH box helicase family protein [Bryobacteraceae bacterium]|nr:DEAD/DEAH box helicase family protein [Bryobacteraceae bacterium]